MLTHQNHGRQAHVTTSLCFYNPVGSWRMKPWRLLANKSEWNCTSLRMAELIISARWFINRVVERRGIRILRCCYLTLASHILCQASWQDTVLVWHCGHQAGHDYCIQGPKVSQKRLVEKQSWSQAQIAHAWWVPCGLFIWPCKWNTTMTLRRDRQPLILVI